jgi:hypothetical protein
MLGFGEIALFILIVLGVLYGIGIGLLKTWNYIVANRRRHRLEREADERQHRKQLADDFAESMRSLNEIGGGSMSFEDYAGKSKRLSKVKQ